MSILEMIDKSIKRAKQAEQNIIDNPDEIPFITIEQYYSLATEQQRQESRNVSYMLLDELRYQSAAAAVESFKFMLNVGIIICKNSSTKKISLLPIIGKGYWKIENWKRFRQLLKDDKESLLPIVGVICKLENGKLRYNAEKVSTKEDYQLDSQRKA